jgi:hypothetical protein
LPGDARVKKVVDCKIGGAEMCAGGLERYAQFVDEAPSVDDE